MTDLRRDGNPSVPEYWHLTDQPALLHNARIGKGVVTSASFLAETTCDQRFVSLYQALHSDKDKEQVWEESRRESFAGLPSRMGAFFLFETQQDATRAASLWDFSRRHALRATFIAEPGSKLHIADSRWLHSPAAEWKRAAENYWSGVMSEGPLREIIVHGRVYFPDWRQPPFELLGSSGL